MQKKKNNHKHFKILNTFTHKLSLKITLNAFVCGGYDKQFE